MAVDDRFKVTGEAAVQRNRGAMLFGQAEGFREPPQRGLDSRAQHDSGRCGILDDDLGPGANAGQQTGEVAVGVGFRDVDRCHTHDDTSISVFPVSSEPEVTSLNDVAFGEYHLFRAEMLVLTEDNAEPREK
jgi:hypothetical protein